MFFIFPSWILTDNLAYRLLNYTKVIKMFCRFCALFGVFFLRYDRMRLFAFFFAYTCMRSTKNVNIIIFDLILNRLRHFVVLLILIWATKSWTLYGSCLMFGYKKQMVSSDEFICQRICVFKTIDIIKWRYDAVWCGWCFKQKEQWKISISWFIIIIIIMWKFFESYEHIILDDLNVFLFATSNKNIRLLLDMIHIHIRTHPSVW